MRSCVAAKTLCEKQSVQAAVANKRVSVLPWFWPVSWSSMIDFSLITAKAG